MRNPATTDGNAQALEVTPVLISGECALCRVVDRAENPLFARSLIPGEQRLKHAALGPQLAIVRILVAEPVVDRIHADVSIAVLSCQHILKTCDCRIPD